MRLALAGLIFAMACAAPAAGQQPSPAAIRAQIEDIARTPRDQLTTHQRATAQSLLKQLYQLEVVGLGPPPKPLSRAASEMLLDDSFEDICAFGLDYYTGRKNLAWAFKPVPFDGTAGADSFAIGQGVERLRQLLTPAEIADLESDTPLDVVASDIAYGDISVSKPDDNTKIVLIDAVAGSMKCHDLTLLVFQSGATVKILKSDPAGCYYSSFELNSFHDDLYVFPIVQTPGELEISGFGENQGRRMCAFKGTAFVTKLDTTCQEPICQAIARQAGKLVNDPDDLLAGEKLPAEALHRLDIPWLDNAEKQWLEAFSIDIDNDGVPEIFMRQRLDYGVLDYKIAKRSGNTYVQYRATNWQLIDNLNDDSNMLSRRFSGNQGLNFIRLGNQTYIVALTFQPGFEDQYDLTIFQAKGFTLKRIGTIAIDTLIRYSPAKLRQ